MTFSEKLIEYRKSRGWKDIIPIHEYTGIPKENLWAWEAGRRIPPIYLQDLLFFKLDRVGLPEGDFKDIHTAVEIVNIQIKQIAKLKKDHNEVFEYFKSLEEDFSNEGSEIKMELIKHVIEMM